MKLHHHLIAAGLLATTALATLAQTPPPAAPAQRGEMMAHRGPMLNPQDRQARMEERMNRRLNVLKLKLALTPAQEGAWTAYVAAMKPPAFQRPDRAEIAKLTTPERIDRMRALHAQRNAEMDKRADATKTFYAALSADQKKVFDGEALHMGPGGHRGSGGMGHPGGGMGGRMHGMGGMDGMQGMHGMGGHASHPRS